MTLDQHRKHNTRRVWVEQPGSRARTARFLALGASIPFTLGGWPWFVLGAVCAVYAVRPPARGPA